MPMASVTLSTTMVANLSGPGPDLFFEFNCEIHVHLT